MKTILICLVTMILGGCGGNRDLQKEEMGTFDSDPENMPEQRTLYSPVPIVLLQVVADESGYSVTPFRALGAPSSTINQEGDVVITAMNADGRPIAVTVVDNPRAVRTAGSRDPKTATLPSARFTISFANPDSIRSIEIKVVEGPNAGFSRTILINPRELKMYQEQER
jgi:hypothetical protein